jgi:hypothetical protein
LDEFVESQEHAETMSIEEKYQQSGLMELAKAIQEERADEDELWVQMPYVII